jgi:hypothetical protein
MTFTDSLADLTRKCDPLQARCLRCTARLRVILGKMAAAHLNSVPAVEWTDDDIDAEVTGLLAAHPELGETFTPKGCPIVGTCREDVAVAPAASWSRPAAVAGFVIRSVNR